MKTRFAVCILGVMLSCSAAYAITLTFDDVPSGTALNYTYSWSYRASFSGDFRATDHTGSAWGPPHSGSNVLTSVGSPSSWIAFGTGAPTYPDPVQSVGAYFSTNVGAMVRITAYHQTLSGEPAVYVTSAVIGTPGDSWNNRYVEISTTPALPFDTFRLDGVNSPNDLLGFSADDMTITLVPEPSSLLALAGGVGALGLLRRRVSGKQ